MDTIGVVGGTGFIGQEVVKELLAANHTVRIIARDFSKVRRLFQDRVEVRFGDVLQYLMLPGALDGCDTVIHCVQFPNHPFENPRKGLTYVKIDGEGTVKVVAAAQDAGAQHFIYVSGAGVHPTKTEPWFVAKRMAEGAIHQSGIPYTIVRPSWIYGPNDRSMNKFVLFAKLLPFIPTIGKGDRQRVMPIFVKDVAKILASCVNNSRALNQTMELGGPDTLTMDEIIRTMLKVMGKRRPLIPQPVALMKLAAFFLQYLPTPPLTPQGIDFACMDGVVDVKPFRTVFPDFPLTPLEKGLQTYL